MRGDPDIGQELTRPNRRMARQTLQHKPRSQAREWLQAGLTAWAKVLDNGSAELKARLAPPLRHRKADTDLVGIRDEEELAKLPIEEREGFKTLSEDYDRLLTKAMRSR
jgi:hypothetical protein